MSFYFHEGAVGTSDTLQNALKDAEEFDIRRNLGQSTESIGLISSQDDFVLLRASSSSLEEFSPDSLLLQQRPAPSLDYFNDLKLPTVVELEEDPPTAADVKEAQKDKKNEEEKDKKKDTPKVAKLIYIDDNASPKRLTESERSRLAEREAARQRKAQRYAEKKQLVQTHPFCDSASVTHVTDPHREIVLSDPEPYSNQKRGVRPGNAVRVRTRRGWSVGFVTAVNDSQTRVGISFRSISNSWYNRGREVIMTTVLPFDSADWKPMKTRTIPGTARRGRPAKVDTSLPSSGPRPRNDDEDASYSSSRSAYYASPSHSAPTNNDNSYSSGVPALANGGRRRVLPPSKHKYTIQADQVLVDGSKRFRFQPHRTEAESSEDTNTVDMSYAERKLARQQQSYDRYLQFLDSVKSLGPKSVFRVRVVVEPTNKSAVETDDAEEETETDDAPPVLTSAVQYADVAFGENEESSDTKTSIFFDRVDGLDRDLGFFGAREYLLDSSNPDEGIYFTEVDERSRQLFDEYMEYAIREALDSSSESDWDLAMLSSSNASLINSVELENDEVLLRKSASLSFADEQTLRVSGSSELPDSEFLEQLNDGIIAPEDTGGFDLSDLSRHYGYIVSAPAKKVASKDVIAAKITAEEASVVTTERSPASNYSVIRDENGLTKVLQPELASKNHTAIPLFESKRAKGLDETSQPLNAKEVVFASDQTLSSLMGRGNVNVYFDGVCVKKIEELSDFLNPTGGIYEEDNASHETELEASNDGEELPSLESLWKYIDLDNLRIDTLIDKPKPTVDPAAAGADKKLNPLQKRQCKPKPVAAVSQKPTPEAPVPTPQNLTCDICVARFRMQHQYLEHLQTRIHRDNVWKNKMRLASIANYGSLEEAPGGHAFLENGW